MKQVLVLLLDGMLGWFIRLRQAINAQEIFPKQPQRPQEPITRKWIVNQLARQSSYSLDLSHCDLLKIDLSGLNLRGVNFSHSRLRFANLSNCLLQDSNFSHANCRGVNFSESDMSRADMTHAYLRDANLTQVHLYRADLENAIFLNANLTFANLYRANLTQAQSLTREVIGGQLVQDSKNVYLKYYQRLLGDQHGLPSEELEEKINHIGQNRLSKGEQVYRTLKTIFMNNGQYADASWAYVKERQLRRKMHALPHARHNFAQEFPIEGRFLRLRRFGFFMRHFYFWILDWIAELSCGYGERPLRPILIAFVTLAGFPFIYSLIGGIVDEDGVMSLLDYFNYSFATFTTLGFEQFTAVTPLAQTLSSIEGLVGISILALLMFVLGNRISRA